MRSNRALANVNFSIRKELAQVIVGSAVTKPEFEHVTLQTLDQTGREIEASALGLQPAYETVEPAHNRSGGDPGLFAQLFNLGKRAAELIVCRFQPERQFLHDRDSHAREFAHHAHERLF